MKKLIIIFLALAACCTATAQQKNKTRHMTVTIVDEHVAFRIGRGINNMFITRDDTAQVQKLVDLNLHVKLRDEPAAYERMLMKLLKPYYEDNWKLVTSAVEFVPNTNTEVFRYYFIKEE